MFPKIEVRHLHAVVVLAEELNFTRAAYRLHITQPALSKQISEVEQEHRFSLFNRDKRYQVELTDAGRVFVEEARSALLHTERAIQLARVADGGAETTLTVGHSPCAEKNWIATILAIRLPLYPKLKIRLRSQFALELVRGVLACDLNFALVTTPPPDAQITSVSFAQSPLYAALPSSHPAAEKERLDLRDLAGDEWILFAKRVHPLVHDAIIEAARRESIVPKREHEIITSQQAVDLVSEHAGIAILPKSALRNCCATGVLLKPLTDASLGFETCVIMRSSDNSRLVNEFVRSFLRQFAPQRLPPKQMELALSA